MKKKILEMIHWWLKYNLKEITAVDFISHFEELFKTERLRVWNTKMAEYSLKEWRALTDKDFEAIGLTMSN